MGWPESIARLGVCKNDRYPSSKKSQGRHVCLQQSLGSATRRTGKRIRLHTYSVSSKTHQQFCEAIFSTRIRRADPDEVKKAREMIKGDPKETNRIIINIISSSHQLVQEHAPEPRPTRVGRGRDNSPSITTCCEADGRKDRGGQEQFERLLSQGVRYYGSWDSVGVGGIAFGGSVQSSRVKFCPRPLSSEGAGEKSGHCFKRWSFWASGGSREGELTLKRSTRKR